MDKRKPHYPLAEVQAKVKALGVAAFTKTALDGGRAMRLTSDEMLKVVHGLNQACFYKSMTTHANAAIWQDVYRAMTPTGKVAYIKITLVADRPVIQFKEK
ncbi:MAG: type II toxin-antitoxin system MqsR family toxin [Alphaproteobacteria bacterium]|nr:type II toxin-antitoxin system MqsR family toxin [Alphaproteobacteria bacterium]